MKPRRSFFSLLLAAPVALFAQKAQGQSAPPQINPATQIRAPFGVDNWVAYVPAQVPNGTIVAFTIPVTPRKVQVFVNGLRQAQASEVLAGNGFDFAISGNTITFQPGPATPTTGDMILVEATL